MIKNYYYHDMTNNDILLTRLISLIFITKILYTSFSICYHVLNLNISSFGKILSIRSNFNKYLSGLI